MNKEGDPNSSEQARVTRGTEIPFEVQIKRRGVISRADVLLWILDKRIIANAQEQSDEVTASGPQEVVDGFTEEESARLIDAADRIGESREAQETRIVMQRLRFVRWLIQQGMLDEFSA